MGEDDTGETKLGIYEGYIIRVYEPALFWHRLRGLFISSDLVPLNPILST